MPNLDITKRLKTYQITSILSIFLTLIGFSYNVYRLEQSEINSNIRTSSFEMLKELANLEQIVYASYYEKDPIAGNPRTGWVKVGIIVDLSMIASKDNDLKTNILYKSWQKNWPTISNDEDSANNIIKGIELVRSEIRIILSKLN